MDKILQEYWNQILTLIGVIVWLVRLEGKQGALEKRMDMVEGISQKLSEISERLSFIEGALKHDHRD